MVDYHPNPRRKDGSLWGCGHPEGAVRVDRAGVVYCGACEDEQARATSRVEPARRDPGQQRGTP